MYEWYEQFCSGRQATGKYRILPALPVNRAANWVDFSTNDYLGFSHSPVLAAGAIAAMEEGTGSTGSRLLSGNSRRLMALENRIASDKGTAAALVFCSGFQANSSVLASLLDASVTGARAVVFFDRLNHASLYQGVFLSGAELVRYPHRDLNRLGALLRKYRDYPGPRFIVTETVFGMDGDVAPVADIAELAKQYQAFLYLDEAHATGVTGSRGCGLSGDFDLTDIPHVVMGTFSKALGCFGAYIACNNIIRQYLVNHCPGFIYSTAPSPMMVGAMQAAWEESGRSGAVRAHLMDLAAILRNRLQQAGLDTGLSETHIVPVILRSEAAVLAVKESLARQQIAVSAVRPPTVPPGTSRLRIALTAVHTAADVDRLLLALQGL